MNIPPPSNQELQRLSMDQGSVEPSIEQPVDPGFEPMLDSSIPRQIPFGRIVIGVILMAVLVNWFWPTFAIRHAEGVLIAEQPYQRPPTVLAAWEHEGYTFTSLAEIELEARVLHTKRYRFGREADTSKYDLALGWGPMSDQWVIDQLKFSQSGRWYYFKADGTPPIAPSVMLDNSANFHTVAETEAILDTIAGLRPGHLISLKGQLVRINTNDGWKWQSSLSRTDRGGGSCELIWVEAIEILNAGN